MTTYQIKGNGWRLDVELVQVTLPDGLTQWVARFPAGQFSFVSRYRDTPSTVIFQGESWPEMVEQIRTTVERHPGCFWAGYQMITAIDMAGDHARRLSDPGHIRELAAGLVNTQPEVENVDNPGGDANQHGSGGAGGPKSARRRRP